MKGKAREMRRTKIVCTIGPASESEEKLRELMLAGMGRVSIFPTARMRIPELNLSV